jgi:hypothetical protein
VLFDDARSSFSIIINYTHHQGYIGMFVSVTHQPLIRGFLVRQIKHFLVSISLVTPPQVLLLFIGRVCLSLSIFSFILGLFLEKRKTIEHDTICRVDFDREAIEHDTIRLASFTIVYTRETSSDKIAFIFFCFVLFLFDLLL